MGNKIDILISLTNGVGLLRVAMQIPSGILEGDAYMYFLEPENKKQIFDLLPPHCQSFGNIVDVEEIFETVIVKK